MKMVGVDPGYQRLGVAVVEKIGPREYLRWSDCLTTSPKLSLSKRLLVLGKKFEQIVQTWQPSVVALERLYLTSNQKTAMAVAETRGLIQYLSAKHGLIVVEFTPQEIKLAVAGYGRADKKQVMTMVERLLQVPPRSRLDDEWDAIAVALTGLIHKKRF